MRASLFTGPILPLAILIASVLVGRAFVSICCYVFKGSTGAKIQSRLSKWDFKTFEEIRAEQSAQKKEN